MKAINANCNAHIPNTFRVIPSGPNIRIRMIDAENYYETISLASFWDAVVKNDFMVFPLNNVPLLAASLLQFGSFYNWYFPSLLTKTQH